MTDTTQAPLPPSPAATMAAPTGPELAGTIGAELASPVNHMMRWLEELRARRSGADTDEALAGLDAAIAQVHEISLRSQQVARLASGRLRQSHEKLELHTLVHEVLLDRQAQLASHGIQLDQDLRPVEIIVDPGLLMSLLQSATDWSAGQGNHLLVKLGMKNWPENGLLVLKATWQPAATRDLPDQDALDSLLWGLLLHTAAAMGVLVSREIDRGGVSVYLEFPRTVRNLSGLTAMDIEPGTTRVNAGDFTDTIGAGKRLQGAAILLITDDPRLQRDVEKVCQRLNLRMDATPSTRQAARLCELSRPQLILIDENLHDIDFDRLHADLVRHNARFPVIEVAPADQGLSISSWDEGSASRIGRDHVAQQLPQALALELGKLA